MGKKPKKWSRRSENYKKRNTEHVRRKRSTLSEEEKAIKKRKDRERKKLKRNQLSTFVNNLESSSETAETNIRISDRTYSLLMLQKKNNLLKKYAVPDLCGVFGAKISEIKWNHCMKCHTRILGRDPLCYCKKKTFVLCTSLKNVGSVPDVLKDLSIVEQLLIAKVHPMFSVYKLRGGQNGYAGHVINFRQDIKGFAKVLPHELKDLDSVITVCFNGKYQHFDFKVRRNVIVNALVWLQKNNVYYKDVVVDFQRIESMPYNSYYEPKHASVDVDNEEDEKETDFPFINRVGVPSFIKCSNFHKLKHNLEWPKISSDPIDEFHSEGYICQAFPCLFPYGVGDFHEVKSKVLTIRVYFQYLMDYEDGRFADHCMFPYFGLNTVMRWECLTKATLYYRKNKGLKKLNVEYLKIMMSDNERISRDLMVHSSNVRSTRSYWLSRCFELQAMSDSLGLPTLFFTLSAADFHWPRLHELLRERFGLSCYESESERHTCIVNGAKICSDYFYEVIELYLNDILYIYFKVADYWYRFEWQMRGSPHVHGVLWIVGSIDVKKLQYAFDEVKQQVINYFDKFISCQNPNTNYVETDEHPCRIRICDVKDVTLDYAALVNAIQKHTKCSPKTCLKKDGTCRYGFPKKLSDESEIVSIKKRLELEPKRNDPFVNKHNPFVLQSWRGNGDVSAILSDGGFNHYIAKYASKAEKKSRPMKEILSAVLESVTEREDLKKVLCKTLMKSVVERDYSAQEIHHILAGKKMFSSSRSFVKLILKKSEWIMHSQLADIQESEDLSSPNIVLRQYSLRPSNMENLPLLEFAKKFCFTTFKARQRHAVVIVYPNVLKWKENVTEINRQLYLLFVPWREFSYEDMTDGDFAAYCEKHNLDVSMLPYYKEYDCNFDSSDSSSEDDNGNDTSDFTDKNKEDWMNILTCNETESSGNKDSKLGYREVDLQYNWSSHCIPTSELCTYKDFIEEMKKDFVVGSRPDVCVTLNADQQRVLNVLRSQIDSMQKGNTCPIRSVLCQGSAGTGKSTIISRIVYTVSECFGASAVEVFCPTGCSALTVGGKTMHSGLSLPFASKGMYPDLNGDSLKHFEDRMKSVKFVILDEYSMVGCKMLSCLHNRLVQLSGSDEPFGGYFVYLFGDLMQLPPIGDYPIFSKNIEECPDYVVDGAILFKQISFVKVLEIPQRQHDVKFYKFLQNLSFCALNEEDFEYISGRFEENLSEDELKSFDDAVHLYSLCKSVHNHNINALEALNLPVCHILSENNCKVAAACNEDQSYGLPYELYLSIGCPVMLRINLWTEAGLVNGAMGVVEDILYVENEEQPFVIMVRFDRYVGPSINGCVPICRKLRSWYVKDTIYCTRYMFPLVLCYAITIYKSQSLTIRKAFLHLDSKERVAGEYYVAMSRLRKLCDLVIAGKVHGSPLFSMNKRMYLPKISALMDLKKRDRTC